ncbi:MAG: cytidylate kinase-like family protein, partial [Candidatus Adiutrix sp.]|jgi:cytidylate kinase|nr:cytidylate kinase-like family protein [Candidatus Adiutrix sp.]
LTFIPFSQVYGLALERNEKFRRRKDDLAEGRGDIDIWEGHFFSHPSFTSLFESIVLELAGRGDVIMVGAAIQAVLRPFPGIGLVYVHAPLEVRVKRFMDLNQITLMEANQTIKWWDQRRRALFEISSIFENTAGFDAYDLTINTDRVSISAASRLLQTMLQELPAPPDPSAWQARLKRLALARRVECSVREAGAALGLAPLEVHPDEDDEKALKLTGFVHSADDEAEALRQARNSSEGHEIKSYLKLLQLHGDLMPPHCWKEDQ